MRRRHVLSVPALAALLATGPLAGTAMAAAPVELTGGAQVTDFVITGVTRTGGDVDRFTVTSVNKLTGDVQGVTISDLTCIGDLEDLVAFTCRGTSTFTGTYDGQQFESFSRTSFRCSFVTDVCKGVTVTYASTGALAGTRSSGTFEQGATSGAGTYTLRVVGL